MAINESQYKYNLSLDVIHFLMRLLLKNSSNKMDLVGLVLDKWEEGIQKTIDIVNEKEAQKIAKIEDVEQDVAAILLSIYQQEPLILKSEFRHELQGILTTTFAQASEDSPKP